MADTTVPKLAIYSTDDTTAVTQWNVKSGNGTSDTVRAGSDSDILEVHAWNNIKGTTEVSDIIDATVTVVDGTGLTTGVVPTNEWVQMNLNGESTTTTVDGQSTTSLVWKKLGVTKRSIRAKGITPADAANPKADTEDVIKGSVNDGTAANSAVNYADVKFKVLLPLNSTPGAQDFKIRFEGYYV